MQQYSGNSYAHKESGMTSQIVLKYPEQPCSPEDMQDLSCPNLFLNREINWLDFNAKDVYKRQVLERPFSEIWDDPNIELLHKLKDKKAHVGGRCAKCRFLNICGGNFRARAEAYYGDEWAQDPACYLTDEEIGL